MTVEKMELRLECPLPEVKRIIYKAELSPEETRDLIKTARNMCEACGITTDV